jgi:hypothetical protein
VTGPLRFPIAGCRLRVEVMRFRRQGAQPAGCVVEVRGGSSLICRLDVMPGSVTLYDHATDETRTIYGHAPEGPR